MPKGVNLSDLPQFDFDKLPLLLNEKQAAAAIGMSVQYLRLARSTGRKEGRTPAPDFVRLESMIRYHREDLKKWAMKLERRQAV